MATVVILFLVAMALGIPIVIGLGFAISVLVLMSPDIPVSVLAHRFYTGMNNFTLMAIPFFVLAGLLMEAGGLSRRIVEFASALVGWIRGSLLFVAVLTSTALAAMSGSGSADTAAVSAILQPELKRRKYDIDFSAALIAGAGTLAQIIPPSIMLVIIAVQNNLSVGALFLAGIVPGLLSTAALMVAAYWHIRFQMTDAVAIEPFEPRKVLVTFLRAIPALGLAVLITGGILTGIMTPTEAAGIGVVYALLTGALIYRELKMNMLPEILVRATVYSASLLLLVATANIFNWIVAESGVLEDLATHLGDLIHSKIVFLIVVNIALMLFGMFIEGIALILLLGSILIHLAGNFGIDPNHMALVIVLNCAIGLITPPFGATLFVAALVARRPFIAVARRALLPWLALTSALVLTSMFPELTLALPRWLGFLT